MLPDPPDGGSQPQLSPRGPQESTESQIIKTAKSPRRDIKSYYFLTKSGAGWPTLDPPPQMLLPPSLLPPSRGWRFGDWRESEWFEAGKGNRLAGKKVAGWLNSSPLQSAVQHSVFFYKKNLVGTLGCWACQFQ